MNNLFSRLPQHIFRLFLLFLVFLGIILLIRIFIPDSLREHKVQIASAVEREKAREIKFAGTSACAVCHEDQYNIKKNGYHKNLSCETCHGPAQGHTENPTEIKPPAPRDRKFCPVCHAYNASRPIGFPQINPVAHNPLQPCITCHEPHDPKPPETPRECKACHGEFERTKEVSPHVLLKCTTCHVTPALHKVTPWNVRPTKPSNREFCGRCHSQESTVAKTAKVDMATHGEKYVCWQCHYPHAPEVE